MSTLAFEVYTEHKGFANEHLAVKVHIAEEVHNKAFERRRFTKYSLSPVISLYWGVDELTGLVLFYAHDATDQAGFGGREFELRMKNGTTCIIKGPWSSRCSVMNGYFPHSIEAVISTGGCCDMVGYILVDRLKLPGYKVTTDLVKLLAPERNEIPYVITPEGTL